MFEGIKVLATGITLLILVKHINTGCNKYLVFVLLAIWSRMALSAFHSFTFPPIIGGFSLNALSSIMVVAFGIFILPSKVFLLNKFFPLYLFLCIVLMSALLNGEITGLVLVLVKWGYFLTITSALVLSMTQVGSDKTLSPLLKTFYLPISLLVLSILLGESKATENDGSTSYIGGYNHEAAFSMVVVSFSLICACISKSTLNMRTSLFFLSVVLLVFVNYRTAMLTVLPILIVFTFASVASRLERKYIMPVVFIMMIFSYFVVSLFSVGFLERFSDVSLVVSSFEELIKAPVYYTELEKDIFSARAYLWSQYVYEWSISGSAQFWFGNGPESWKGVFSKYAHNTYISSLYEHGLVGLLCLIYFFLKILIEAFSIDDKLTRLNLIGFICGFLIMNFATMPLWNIEGLILLSILCSIIYSRAIVKNKPKGKVR